MLIILIAVKVYSFIMARSDAVILRAAILAFSAVILSEATLAPHFVR
jgi:hypothetical protein